MIDEIARAFHVEQGAVVVTLKDSLGRSSIHTIYVSGPNGAVNVEAELTRIKAELEAAAAAVQAGLTAAGWKADGNTAG